MKQPDIFTDNQTAPTRVRSGDLFGIAINDIQIK